MNKFTRIDKIGKHGPERGLIIGDTEEVGDVFSIQITDDYKVVFEEECDNYYSARMTKAEAIDVLEECIRYIKGD